MQETLWELVSRTVSTSGPIEKTVFFLLLALSIASWTFMLMRFLDVAKARANNLAFFAQFAKETNMGTLEAKLKTLGESPAGAVFRAGVEALKLRSAPDAHSGVKGVAEVVLQPDKLPVEMIMLRMQNASDAAFAKLRKGLGFLATTGSTSPFIGLFGTVWGIITTFQAMGNSASTSLAVVAPGISSALIATAVGLAVAIPAVVGYNLLLAQLNVMQDRTEGFVRDLAAVIRASGVLESKEAAQAAPPEKPASTPAATPAAEQVPGGAA